MVCWAIIIKGETIPHMHLFYIHDLFHPHGSTHRDPPIPLNWETAKNHMRFCERRWGKDIIIGIDWFSSIDSNGNPPSVGFPWWWK